MTVKIDGTNGIDTAQLRAPDGDPVAMTIDALGKLAFPAQGQSLTANGYVKLPGGLIIQWGKVAGAAGVIGVTFPIPFPTACVGIQGMIKNISPSLIITVNGQIDSPSGATLLRQFWNGTVLGNSSEDVYWTAIGY